MGCEPRPATVAPAGLGPAILVFVARLLGTSAVLVPSVSGVTLPRRFGAVPLTQELREWREGKGVLITSWKRFRGLGAGAAVIVEDRVRNGNNSRANANRYVARSRAKHRLTVIEAQEE